MKSKRHAHLIEQLESRRMLAVFNGTSGSDTIDISIQAGGAASIVSINGVPNVTADPTITINAGEGNDTFKVFRVRSGTTVLARGDGGFDTLVNPTSGSRDLDAVYNGALTFDGGLGTDLVIADNSADTTTPYEIDVAGYAIEKGFGRLLEYDNVEGLQYYDSEGSNVIKFHSMDGTPTRDVSIQLYGNGGNDTFYNDDDITGTGDWPTSIGSGGALIDGGADTDALQLSNGSFSGANVYTFNVSTIDVGFSATSGTGLLTYAQCESIDFTVGGFDRDDVVNLISKPSNVTLRFDAGSDDDTFTVGGGDIDNSGFLLANTTLLGGAGSDQITFNDVLDNQNDGTTSNYTFGTFTLTKGSAGFNYSAFETQRLDVANGTVVGQLNVVPVVNLQQTSAEILSTTIKGGGSRLASVNVANGGFSSVPGTVDVQLAGGSFLNSLNVNFQNDAASREYRLTQTALLLPKQITYSGVGALNIKGGFGTETYFIDGVPAGCSVTVTGNTGNDTFTLGAGNVDANLLGPVTFSGGAGVNTATVNNTTDASAESQVLNGAMFIDGQTHTFSSLAKLTINGGPGGTSLAINSTTFQTDINGGSGNDSYDIGNGDLDANLLAGASQALVLDGNGGNDSIRFNDFNDAVANSDSYIFQQTNGIDQLRRLDTSDVFVNWADIEGVTLDQSNAPQVGNLFSGTFVNLINTPLRINGNGGLDSIQVEDATTPVFVHTGLGDRDNLSINGDGDAILATVVIEQDDDIENLTISAGGTLRITSNAVVAKTRLGLNPSLDIAGVLDLAGGTLLSRAGGPALDFFKTCLARGYNGGAWNGTHGSGAINSSLAAASSLPDAVGYGLGSQIAPTTLGSFTITPADVVLRYTFYGDADLNGVVNFDDYSRTDLGFNAQRTGWVNGDFNYDNIINFDDYALIDRAFNTQAGTVRRPPPARPPFGGKPSMRSGPVLN